MSNPHSTNHECSHDGDGLSSCMMHKLDNATERVLQAIEEDRQRLFAPAAAPNLSVDERLRVAWYICLTGNSFELATGYRSRLKHAPLSAEDTTTIIDNRLHSLPDQRLKNILLFTKSHIGHTDRATTAQELESLISIGLQGQDIALLKKLIHFVGREIQIDNGLHAISEEQSK